MSYPFDPQTIQTAKSVTPGVQRPQSLLSRRTARQRRREVRGF